MTKRDFDSRTNAFIVLHLELVAMRFISIHKSEANNVHSFHSVYFFSVKCLQFFKEIKKYKRKKRRKNY